MNLARDPDLDFLQHELMERARSSMMGFTKYTKPDYEINWHHRLLCKFLDDFVEKRIRRAMIFMPPRHGKSELGSRRLPAYIMGRNPNTSIIGASYAADLSSRMNRDVQRIMDDLAYMELFPESRLNGDNVRTVSRGALRNNDIFEIIGHKGVYRSVGVGGGITGMGAEYLIIDDPVKNQDEADSETYREKLWEWYASTAYTRLEKDGCVLLIMTRWHEDDLAGRLIAAAKADPTADQWAILNMPAIRETMTDKLDPRPLGEALWPNKYDVARLQAIRSTVGPRVWNSLYQQRPSAMEGSFFKRDWWQYYKQLPARFDIMLQSWDLSFKESKDGSFVVGQVWGRSGPNKYLVDQVRARADFPTTLRMILSLSAKYPRAHTKLIEDRANGPAVIDTLKKELAGLIPVEPNGTKEARASAVSADVEARNVYLPDPSIAPWVHDYVEELANFPKGSHDDQVDATTQALHRLRHATMPFLPTGVQSSYGQ